MTSVYRINKTGGAAISATATVPSGMCYRLMGITAHLSAAPVTAGSLTVTLNAQAGADYDTLLQTASLVGLTDWVWLPDQDLLLLAGDAVDVAYTNPDLRTVGVLVTLKAV